MAVRKFRLEKFLPRELFERITDVRVGSAPISGDIPLHQKTPVITQLKCRRKRRRELTRDGKLTILAADHPARMVTNVWDDPIALGDRYEFLGRIVRVLTVPGWDGIMGTADVLEELLILDYLVQEEGGESFLNDKVMIGCMNRGGLKGATFEMDDKFTSFTAESIYWLQIEGAKLMFRLTPSEEACVKTIESCARAINELNRRGINVFLECLFVSNKAAGYKIQKDVESLVKVISVATALGDSSRNLWLKVPYCEGFERVARATTCPILMLGGEATGDPTPLLEDFVNGMKAGKNVRGVLAGRNILFPGDDDPRAIAAAINGIVHNGYGVEEALKCIKENRGKNMKLIPRRRQ